MPLIGALARQRQADLYEIEDSLVYKASVRMDSKPTQKNLVLKQTNKYNRLFERALRRVGYKV